MVIKISAPIKPVPFKRVMASGKRRFNSKGYTEFKEQLGYFALMAMAGREPLKGAIRLHATFFKPARYLLAKQWGDLDNFLKAVMDSLNGICYLDDSQVKKISAEKFIGYPHIDISLEELK